MTLAPQEDDEDDQYEIEIVLAKKEFTEARKGLVTKWGIKWKGYDSSDQMTWEPAGNLANVRDDVDAFEHRLASMPARDAFTAAAGASACCFGSICKFSSNPDMAKVPCFVCAKEVHHLCASEHPFLKPFYSKFESNHICFDCALLVALVEKRTPFGLIGGQLMFEPYYRQLRGIAALTPSPFGLGALLTTNSLKLVEPSLVTARPLPAVAKCAKCKSSEGELRVCSFCKSGIYHDTPACLGEQRGPEASLTYKAFTWCCPKCFKKGKTALEKTLLAPMQPTAGPKGGQKVVAAKEKAKREQEQSKSSKSAKAKVPKVEEPIKVLTLPHTAAHCRTLPHTAAHCPTLPLTAAHCRTLPHTTNQGANQSAKGEGWKGAHQEIAHELL